MDTQPLILFRKAVIFIVILTLSISLTFISLGPVSLAVRPSQAAFPGSNGKIAYADASGIKAFNPDGSGEQTLLSGASSPAWSSDGKKIAYVAPHNSGSGIFIADAVGSNPEYITIGADPAWSPDGNKLVFMGGIGGLCIRDLATGVETQLTQFDPNFVDYHGMPAWQPGGNKIVFLRHWYSELPYEHYDIWLVNADGSGLSQLTDVGVAADDPDPGLDFDPSWSPDGFTILFIRSVADVGIYTIGEGGFPLKLLKSTPGSSPFPAWSPDEDKIAYISYNSVSQPPTYEIHVMETDGENDQVIISKTEMIAELDWGVSPDKHEFVVNSDNSLTDEDPSDGDCDTGNDVPGGDPECTLLAAIEESNALPGEDTITFDIPGIGVPLIEAPDGFDITDPVVIDGSTQPGVGKVEIDGGISYGEACGTTNDPDMNGFMITAGPSTLRGLVIHGFCDWGIVLRGGNSVIEGNYIGTDASGTLALGNGGKLEPDYPGGWQGGGIKIESANNLIGGTNHTPGVCDGACNLISGNSLAYGQPGIWDVQPAGIQMVTGCAVNNTIYGNFVGTDIAGRRVPAGGAQQRVGIEIYFAEQNVIGGGTLGARNLISGNEYYGVLIQSMSGYPNPNKNIVRGNLIGTDATGAMGIGGGQSGVRIEDSWENQILDNVISSEGGGSNGVTLIGEMASGNIVQDNLIGTAADGVASIGIYNGVVIMSDANENAITNNNIAYGFRGIWAIASNNNQIFGNILHHLAYGVKLDPETTGLEISNNSIHHNQVGVWVLGEATTRNRISANSIYANSPASIDPPNGSGLGIDLGPEGPTVNDVGDYDTGPNTLLNFPALGFAALLSSGDLRIGGTYDSILGSHPYRIEFFANRTCDPNGYGEGERFLGFADVTTDLTGRVVIDVTQLQTNVSPGQFVTATTIDEHGNTSEFSRCVEAHHGTGLTADAASGSMELQVSNTGGFLAGDLIRINPGGANQEDNQVVGFGSLLLATPLQLDHLTGEPVVVLSTRLYLPMVRR